MKKTLLLTLALLLTSFMKADVETFDFTGSNEAEWNANIRSLENGGWAFYECHYNTKYGNGTQIRINDSYISSPVFSAPITGITITGTGSSTAQIKMLDGVTGEELALSDKPFTTLSIAFEESRNLTSFKLKRNTSGTLVVHSITIQFASTLESPKNFTVNIAGTSAILNWDAVSGADSYTIGYAKDGNEPVYVTGVTGTSYTFESLDIGRYNFTISAINANTGYGSLAAQASGEISPAAPVNLQVSETTDSGFTLSWNAVDGATYSIYLNGELYEDAVATTAFTFANLQAGTYQVEVSATVNGIESVKSAAINATIEATTALVAPTVFDVVDASFAGFTANWSQVGGEGTTYTLTVLRNGNAYASYPNISQNSQFVKINALGTYTFSVTASNGGQTTAPSAQGEAKITLSAPEAVEITGTDLSSIKLAWGDAKDAAGAVPQVLGYSVLLEKDAAGNDQFGEAVEYDFDAAPAELEIDGIGIYRIKVAAKVAGADDAVLTGEYSQAITTTVQLPVPAVVEKGMAGFTSSSFTAEWTAVDGAIAYDVVVSASSDLSVAPVTNRTAELSFSMENLETSDWSWSVRAVAEEEKFSSGFSAIQTVDLSSWLDCVPAIAMYDGESDNGGYSNDFEELWPGKYTVWADASTLHGWYAIKNGAPVYEYATDNGGTKNMNSFLRLHNDEAHYAMGAHPAATSFAFGLALTNNSSFAVKKMRIIYTAAQYRMYKTGTAQINLKYLIGTDSVKALTDTEAWESDKVYTPENMSFTTTANGTASECYLPQSFTNEISFAGDELASGKVMQLRWDVPAQGDKLSSYIPKIGIDSVTVEWTFDRPQGTLMLLY